MYLNKGIITGIFSYSELIFKIRKLLLTLISFLIAFLENISSIFNLAFSSF